MLQLFFDSVYVVMNDLALSSSVQRTHVGTLAISLQCFSLSDL